MTDRTSRAVVLERFGAPLAIREFPLPAAPPGGMIVASSHGGVCGTDLHLQQGHLDVPVPLVLGHEGLGTVHELAEGVDRDTHGAPLAVGDRVMWASSIACGVCVPCSVHLEPTLCERRRTYGVNRSVTEDAPLAGSWAEHIELMPGTTVIRLPDGIEPLTAMSLACAGPTMAHAFERRPVRLGETVLVQGSGPVGLAAAAMAQLAGARRVIVAGGPAERLGLAADLGIGTDHVDVVGAADQESALAEVLALTGGRGADLVIECTGVPTAVGQGLRLARRGGSYLVVGQYTDSGDALINPHQIVHRQLDVVGSWAFTGAHLARYMSLLPELAARFDLVRLVTTYALEDSASALHDVTNGKALKAVLVS
ncbi:zinc-binding dehydrogenase [Streptomyces sp. NPDC002793]|uniref:zinc-binding dehydrogenase n=1 Tax=Streptomyces sp. NPDC002793 TaxID=3154432 RepID=UPI00332FFC4F